MKLGNGKPLVQIPKENAHLDDLEWTVDEQAESKTLVEKYTSQGASGAWRVHRWHLPWFSLILGDTEDISKMYFSHWKAPGVSERMWSINLDASISGEYQTLGGHSCRPSE